MITRKRIEFKILLDDEDYKKLKILNWNISNSHSSKTRRKYYVRHGKKVDGKVKYLYMHRLIMNPLPGMVVDHLNGNGLDCRRCNLAVTTQQENVGKGRKVYGNKHNINREEEYDLGAF